MLKLDNIKKDYPTSSMTVHALKGVSIDFRTSEFVSILGPSGCGKTTMLNIIGGLDRLTDGDLKINGVSTKDFKSRDWDVYRNHRVGFVFQSYNLIPHQTVLSNVELALTIAGIDKTTRRAKAKLALEKVGLSDQIHKRPNQLSGGQCQRVAIARALVNDPEILLADEPTGALDTETSKQIMNLIKEISKEKLVIMVTHNNELAAEYSTRIIKLLDGLLLSDSNPMSEQELLKQDQHRQSATPAHANTLKTQHNTTEPSDIGHPNNIPSAYTEAAKITQKKEKAKMSFFTAFRLSLSNLFTKKARTIVMAIASAIGIIGVSLVLAISFGVQNFIADMQNDMLAGNPIQINQTGFDMDAISRLMEPSDAIEFERGSFINIEASIANIYSMIDEMDDIFVQNRIDRNYIQFLRQMPTEYYSAMHFNYGLNTTYSFFNNFNGRHTSIAGITATYASVLQKIDGFEEFAGLLGMIGNPIRQAPDFSSQTATDYLLSQFDVVATVSPDHDGIARDKNEVMIVLSRDNVLTDIMLGQLGVLNQDEFINIIYYITNDEENFDESLFSDRIEFDRLINQEFIWQPNDNIFSDPDNFRNPHHFINVLGEVGGDLPFVYNPVMNANWTDGVELTVVGILSPKEDVNFVMMDAGVFYTAQLAEYIIYRNWNSNLIEYMLLHGLETLGGMAMIDVPIPPDLPNLPPNFHFIAAVSGNIIPFAMDFNYKGQSGTSIGLVGSGGGSLMSLIFGGGGGGGAAGMEGVTMSSIGMRQFGGNVYRVSVRATDDNNQYIRRYERATDEDGEYIGEYVRATDNSGNYIGRYVRVTNADGEYAGEYIRAVCDCGNELYDENDDPLYEFAYEYIFSYVYLFVHEYAPVRVLDADGNYVYINGQPVYELVYEMTVHFDRNGNITALPNSISIFSSSFEQVDNVTGYLRSWNNRDAFGRVHNQRITLNFECGEVVVLEYNERERVQYTDMLSLIMTMISQMIQIITIALVAFTALSLVVSSVMIGILTYVSVMERIKEIGVIRSLGGRKRDVSNLFTAETFILGFTAGLFGIIITYILQGLINLIVGFFAGGITIAALPIWVAAIMVGVSVLLTVVAGAAPSRSAAKKDPVVALRTE